MRHTEETDAVFPHSYSFADGYLYPGDAPGHGVDIDEGLAAKYPYKPASLPIARLGGWDNVELVMAQKNIVCFGECMIELSRTILGGQSWAVQYAGDSYNVAAYMARLGCTVSYMTALGKDHFSDEMQAEWKDEGVNTDLVVIHPDRIPGLYSIRVDEHGERTFFYWREKSAARAFFDCPGADLSMQRAESADLLYLSGITLSLFSNSERERIYSLARAIRSHGGEVVARHKLSRKRLARRPHCKTARWIISAATLPSFCRRWRMIRHSTAIKIMIAAPTAG